MKFKTATLGCKVNQYETQYVRTALLANGWTESVAESELESGDTDGESDVDLVLVNTCSVTAESDAKSRKAVSRMARKCPNARIIVMGCFAAAWPKVAAELPQVQKVLTDKRDLDSLLKEIGCTKLPGRIDSFEGHHRAFVKIQDGCRVGCAYCIIPKVRPYLQSRSIPEILAELDYLCEQGYRELVLTGIHLGHYGLNTPSPSTYNREKENELFAAKRSVTLAGLLTEMAKRKYPARFRLGSLEAVEVSDELLEVIASHSDLFTPHFHLSMQSGSDTVLERMARRWKSGPFIEECERIRRRIPDAALTTDVIVGFPGETDAEFERTCEVVERLRFSKVHLFRFSSRPGTKAAEMPDQLPESVKKERSARLEVIAARLRAETAASFVGKNATVLLEDRIYRDGKEYGWTGTTEHYFTAQIPDDSLTDGDLRCGILKQMHLSESFSDGHLLGCFFNKK